MRNMLVDRDKLTIDLHNIVSTARDRVAALQGVAELLKSSGSYRWVGLYDVDRAAGTVTNMVWSGPGAPEYPTFPITKGLTGAAISARKTVMLGTSRPIHGISPPLVRRSRRLLFLCSTGRARTWWARLTSKVKGQMRLVKTYRFFSKPAPK